MDTDKRMTFRRYGRTYQLQIASAEDLAAVTQLDEAHWAATNAPVSTLNADPTLLSLLDTRKNGRIICHELRDAIRWTLETLSDRTALVEGSDVLCLASINADTADGDRARSSAARMLTRLGKPGQEQISLADVRAVKAQVEANPVSEAGVVLPSATRDEHVRQFLADVVATVGGAPHPSGMQGVGQSQLDAFLTRAKGLLDWQARGDIPAGQERTDIMPLGERTDGAYELLCVLRAKIDQYFAQCEAVALDENFSQRMGWTAPELDELDFDDPAIIEQVLQQAPLAKASAERTLPFDGRVNPCYVALLDRFGDEVAAPALGSVPTELSARQWGQIKGFFAAHQAWIDAKVGSAVEPLGAENLRKYLDEHYARATASLMAESAQTAVAMDNIRLAEKLILFQAGLMRLANNFVSFPHLYDPAARAMFEMGSLVMDGRWFNLAVKVDQRAAHAEVAKSSNMYVLYVEVTPSGGAAYEVAVPVTSGGKGNLCGGKRGVFYDLAGNECDARIVAIIENPIGLREALVAPFKRLGAMITGRIESLSAKADKTFDAQAATAIGGGAPAQPAPAAQPQASQGQSGGAMLGGLIVGGGVALAALGSATAYIIKTFSQVHPLAILIGVLIAFGLVLLPTSILAILKLRRRDLSAILEGSGWAVNLRMRLTRRQARQFTRRPPLPAGAIKIRKLLPIGDAGAARHP